MAWTSLCDLSDLTEGRGHYVEIGGYQLAVFLHEGRPYVIDNYCPHAGGNLAAGPVQNGCAVCPWHGWAFRLDSGELFNSPAVSVRTYATKLLERADLPTLVQADLPMY